MKTRFFSLALISAAASFASAGSLTVSGMVPGKSRTINVALFGTDRVLEAGPQAASYDSDSFEGYCIDLAHNQRPPVTFEANPTEASSFLPNGSRIAQLVNKYALSAATRDEGAALQIAIWDVLVDGGDGIDAGNFKVSDLNEGTSSLVGSYLSDSLTSISTLATVYDPTSHGPNNDLYQGLVAPGGEHLSDAVPEPASMVALVVGGVALLRRRKKA